VRTAEVGVGGVYRGSYSLEIEVEYVVLRRPIRKGSMGRIRIMGSMDGCDKFQRGIANGPPVFRWHDKNARLKSMQLCWSSSYLVTPSPQYAAVSTYFWTLKSFFVYVCFLLLNSWLI
jgi:hypothetical protein